MAEPGRQMFPGPHLHTSLWNLHPECQEQKPKAKARVVCQWSLVNTFLYFLSTHPTVSTYYVWPQQLNLNPHPVISQPKLQNYSPVRTGVFVGKTEQKANLRNTQHALEEGACLQLLWSLKRPVEMGRGEGRAWPCSPAEKKIATNTTLQ